MAATSELSALHTTLHDLRLVMNSVRDRYGDVPAVRRLAGDLDRFELDAAEVDALPPAGAKPASNPTDRSADFVTVIDDRPLDPALWAGCDDEGLGGYQR